MESQSSAVETKKKDKEILISIVNEMAESMTGDQSTERFISSACFRSLWRTMGW